MKWLDRFAERLFSSPLLWGGVLSCIFHVALDKIPIKLPTWLAQRLTGQWESYVCTTLFLIAIAFVVLRCIRLGVQIRACHRFESDGAPTEGSGPVPLARRLEELATDGWAKKSLLYRRLQEAQQLCQRPDTGTTLPSLLKELSDADHDRLHADYGLMRTLIWAIPSCGSVATILAIANTVERLPGDNSADVLASTAAGLAGAFHLFAFAVGLAIVLVVLKFAVEQGEQFILAAIDRQVSQAMPARIGERAGGPASPDNQLQQLTEVLKSVAHVLTQQSQSGSRMPAAASAAAAPTKDIEAVVQSAIAGALARQPALGMAGEPASLDSAGWKGLQQVLQKLVHVLEQQYAKVETEGRVSKQLTTIIDEGLKETNPPLRIHDPRQAAAA